MGRFAGGVLLAGAVGLMLGPGCDEGDTVTTPTLSSECAARPSQGPAPLEVSFTLGVSGAQGPLAVTVSYGDGATSSDPDATHVYTTPGLYTASFTVNTGSQTTRCATTVTVSEGTGSAPPSDGDNLPPVAVFKTTPSATRDRISGSAPLSVRFNMCATSDPEDDRLYFTMDFERDGKLDVAGMTGAACRRDNVYAAGTWSAEVCVTDVRPGGSRLHEFQCRIYTVVATP